MGKRRKKASPAVETGQAAGMADEQVHGGPPPAPGPRLRQPKQYRLTHKASVHAGGLRVARGETINERQYATLPERVRSYFEVATTADGRPPTADKAKD